MIATSTHRHSESTIWPDVSAGAWYVLRTRSRQEKILSQDLSAKRVAHFLPLVTGTKYYGGRRARVELPLFPGYLFLRGTLDDAYAVDRSGRVAQIILVPNQRRIDEELRNIHGALNSNAVVNPYPYLTTGARVEVREGPFQGLRGVIESHANKQRLILQVEALGQAVSVEIDGSLLDVTD